MCVCVCVCVHSEVNVKLVYSNCYGFTVVFVILIIKVQCLILYLLWLLTAGTSDNYTNQVNYE